MSSEENLIDKDNFVDVDNSNYNGNVIKLIVIKMITITMIIAH
jgi:hypothetical protein